MRKQYNRLREEWHKWFAWFPVRANNYNEKDQYIGNDNSVRVWLEVVFRKRIWNLDWEGCGYIYKIEEKRKNIE